MSTVALEIGSDGLRYSYLPEPLDLDGENEFEAVLIQWPNLMQYEKSSIPTDMEERLLTYGIVTEAILQADHVIVSVRPEADRRRVGISEVALEVAGCSVEYVEAHSEGVTGIIRGLADDLIQNCQRPRI